jgi:ABC-type multidrug transport system fused ATPase/permease subunit
MGTNLSGGQKQKIAISRVLFKDSKLVILDEPTSSIDKLSEDKIFKEIHKYIKNKTTLIISHNFTIVKYIPKIIVLNHGTIVEQGHHEELMRNKGYYYKLYNTQAKHFEKTKYE